MNNLIRITRLVSFSSGHRYWKTGLSKEDNEALFGRFASFYNHGHNYELHLTVQGKIDPKTGMVVNIAELKEILHKEVLLVFDQKSINDEVTEFYEAPPSLENLLRYFAKTLSNLEKEIFLVSLKLKETPTLYGEWDKIEEGSLGKISLTRIYEFAASHRLHSPLLSEPENTATYGLCNNPKGHGHNYLLEVSVTGEINETTGMICNLEELDQIVSEHVLQRYDHKNLNEDIEEFRGQVTTSEIVATEIWKQLVDKVPAKLERIRLHETARNIFEVRESVT